MDDIFSDLFFAWRYVTPVGAGDFGQRARDSGDFVDC